MDSTLAILVGDFAANPVISGSEMRKLLDADAKHFLAAARPMLQSAPDIPGFYFLLTLLLSHDLILRTVCDPSLFTTQESIALARRLARVEPNFDVKLAKVLLAPGPDPSRKELEENAKSPAGRRLLEIVSAISEGNSSMLITQLLEHPDQLVRSKAALLVGKSNRNAKWVQGKMGEQDGRVRANALEALWGVTSNDCRSVFWSSVADPDNRVAGNAVLGLYRLGDPATIGLMLEMLKRPELDFQNTGAWVMGETGDLRFLPGLERRLENPSPTLRTHLFQAVMKLKQRRTRLASLPPVNIQVLSDNEFPGGWKEVALSVRTKTGAVLHGLKATDIALSSDGELITEYEVRELIDTRPLWVGFALPPQCREAHFRCSPMKRINDTWMMLEVTGNLWHVTRTLLTAAAAVVEGMRHLMLIDDGDSDVITPDELDKLVRRTRAARVTMQGIGIGSEALQSLCADTGGKFHRAADEDAAGVLLDGLYAPLTAAYQVRFRSRGDAQLKIEICADQGLAQMLTN